MPPSPQNGHETLRLSCPLVLSVRTVLGTGSLIHLVGSASISPHLVPSRVRRYTPRSTCNPLLRPTLAPGSPRWLRVWRRTSRASVRGCRIGLSKMWPQRPEEKGRDPKVIRLRVIDSRLYLSPLPLPVMGRKGIVKPSSKSRVYLPDVTGLTSAVESPARVRLDYHRVNPADREIQSECFSATVVYRHLINLFTKSTS